MTGDGANDAPAIRLADVGIALGRRATPAARAAADLVVTDDRIETIIDAIVEGRAMWGSVRDALGILLGGNLGEIAFTRGCSAAVTGRSRAERPPAAAGQPAHRHGARDGDRGPAARRGPQPTGCSARGRTRSLGGTLTREIALRAAATTAGRRPPAGPSAR